MARTRRSPRKSIPPVHEIRQRLKRLARALLRQRGDFVRFTGDEKADRLLNDLIRAPHLFVIGSIADYQVKAEKAWNIPVALARRAGGKSFGQVNALSRRSIRAVIKGPPAMHRFPAVVADRIRRTLDRIASQYGGDASRIWSGRPSSALVVYRFLEFHGIGQKVANMATNILARSFAVPFADHYSIDISVDVHVRRVMTRLGLVPPKATIEQVTFAARALNPVYPGLMDLPCFHIGRTWCRPRRPLCGDCPMNGCCPSARDEGK